MNHLIIGSLNGRSIRGVHLYIYIYITWCSWQDGMSFIGVMQSGYVDIHFGLGDFDSHVGFLAGNSKIRKISLKSL